MGKQQFYGGSGGVRGGANRIVYETSGSAGGSDPVLERDGRLAQAAYQRALKLVRGKVADLREGRVRPEALSEALRELRKWERFLTIAKVCCADTGRGFRHLSDAQRAALVKFAGLDRLPEVAPTPSAVPDALPMSPPRRVGTPASLADLMGPRRGR